MHVGKEPEANPNSRLNPSKPLLFHSALILAGPDALMPLLLLPSIHSFTPKWRLGTDDDPR